MKPFGKTKYLKIILFFIGFISILWNISCVFNRKLPSNHNNFVKEEYIYFSNDSLKIFLKYAGDYVFDKNFNKKDFSNLKTPLSKYFRKKFYVFSNNTNLSPSLASALFIVPNYKFRCSDLRDFVKFKADSNYSCYQYTGTSRYTLYRVYPYLEMNSYLVFCCKAMSKQHFYNIKEFDEKVFPSLKIGKDYKKHIPKSPFDEANRAFFSYDSSLNYIAPITMLQKTRKQYKEDIHTYIQAMLTYTSFIENHDSLKIYLNKWIHNTYYRYNKNIDIEKSNISLDNDFLESINMIADTNQVVMLNETHFVPENRFLLYNLLDIFYQKGFLYLAAEAIWENGDTLTKRGYPILSSGFYTRESTMSNMIRKAICLGFKIVNYDDFTGERELKQAENIYHKTIAKDSEAKVLVYAGLGHIHKADTTAKKLMMASYFKNISGINPFTIDQLELYPSSQLYENQSVGIVTKNNFPQNRKAINVDAYIINNLNTNKDYLNNDTKTLNIEFDIPDHILSEPKNETLVAYLYNKTEYEQYTNKAIPISIRVLKEYTTNLTYKIDSCRQGKLLLLFRNAFNDVVFKKNIE